MLMLPSRKQYQRWTLPSKWTFWAGLMAIASLALALAGLVPDRSEEKRQEREIGNLIFQATQELRYNSEWLSSLAVQHENKSQPLSTGKMKTGALVKLTNSEFERIVQYSYGEEKHIYQEIYKLSDLALALDSPKNHKALKDFDSTSEYTLHDVIFLNDFLWWYLTPLAEDTLTQKQLYSMGWKPFPGREFEIYGVDEIQLRNFVDRGKPITEFGHYLGLLD